MLPSKELLSAVFCVKIYDYGSCGNSMIEYSNNKGADLSRYRTINIYELMHMMKEWAAAKDFELYTYRVGNEYWCDEYDRIIPYTIQTGSTETEAVTKACEWILEQQNEQ